MFAPPVPTPIERPPPAISICTGAEPGVGFEDLVRLLANPLPNATLPPPPPPPKLPPTEFPAISLAAVTDPPPIPCTRKPETPPKVSEGSVGAAAAAAPLPPSPPPCPPPGGVSCCFGLFGHLKREGNSSAPSPHAGHVEPAAPPPTPPLLCASMKMLIAQDSWTMCFPLQGNRRREGSMERRELQIEHLLSLGTRADSTFFNACTKCL